jgi:membrane protein
MSGEPVPERRIERYRARAVHYAESYQALSKVHPTLALPVSLGARYISRQGMLLASAVAFRLFLWLMPTALLVAGILAGISHNRPHAVHSTVHDAGVTGAASKQIISSLEDGGRGWWVAVIVGVAGMVWTGRTLVRNLIMVHAHAWAVRPPKIRQRQAIGTAAMCALAWLAILAVSVFVAQLDALGYFGVLVSAVVQMAGLSAIWLFVSTRLPNTARTWQDLLPGALIFGAAIATMHALSRVYLPARIEHSSNLYGALGIAAVLLAWLLIIGHIIVGTAMVNSLYVERQSAPATAQPQLERPKSGAS